MAKITPFETVSMHYENEIVRFALFKAMPDFEYNSWARRQLKDFVKSCEIHKAHQFGIDVGNPKDFDHVLFISWARNIDNGKKFIHYMNNFLRDGEYPKEFIDTLIV